MYVAYLYTYVYWLLYQELWTKLHEKGTKLHEKGTKLKKYRYKTHMIKLFCSNMKLCFHFVEVLFPILKFCVQFLKFGSLLKFLLSQRSSSKIRNKSLAVFTRGGGLSTLFIYCNVTPGLPAPSIPPVFKMPLVSSNLWSVRHKIIMMNT